MANYDSLHRQCRTLESLFDAKLTSYARLAASISRTGTNDDDLEAGPSWREAESEVEDLLEKVRSLLSTPLSLDEPRRPTDEVARRDERGARRSRKRHIQPPFAIHVTCYPTPPGCVPRLRKRVQTDKGTLSFPCPRWASPDLMCNVTVECQGGR